MNNQPHSVKTNLIIAIVLASIANVQAQKQQPRTPKFTPSVRQAFEAPGAGQGNQRPSLAGNSNSRGSSAGRVFTGGNQRVVPGMGRDFEGVREGMDVASRLRNLESLRDRLPERLYDPEKFRTGGGGQPRPQDPREAGNYKPRDPVLPSGVSRNQRSRFTDVRGAANGSARGSGASRDELSASSLMVFDYGRERRFGLASGFIGTFRTGYERNDATGDVVAYVEFGGKYPGRYSVTEHRDASGQVTRITETTGQILGGGKIIATERRRDSDGILMGTSQEAIEHRSLDGKEKDAKGGSADTTSGGPGKKTGGDRSPTEISNGGPGGPSIKKVSGITSLDLLRQHAEGSGLSGKAAAIRSSVPKERIRSVPWVAINRPGSSIRRRLPESRKSTLSEIRDRPEAAVTFRIDLKTKRGVGISSRPTLQTFLDDSVLNR